MSDEGLLVDLVQVDVLRMTAAAAAPAIDRLIAAGLSLGLSESEAYSAIGVPKSLAVWCRKVQRQGMEPAKEAAAV
jgi:hypothetical protein